jgi:hypothetical protein
MTLDFNFDPGTIGFGGSGHEDGAGPTQTGGFDGPNNDGYAVVAISVEGSAEISAQPAMQAIEL